MTSGLLHAQEVERIELHGNWFYFTESFPTSLELVELTGELWSPRRLSLLVALNSIGQLGLATLVELNWIAGWLLCCITVSAARRLFSRAGGFVINWTDSIINQVLLPLPCCCWSVMTSAAKYRQWFCYSIAIYFLEIEYSWIADQVSAHEKSICRRTRRVTTIPRPPLKSSRREEFRSIRTIFV